MKKLIALLSLVVFAAPVFAGNAMTLSEAVENLKHMASASSPNQTGNIEPAIAGVIDAYHANTPFASLLAETKLTFATGERVTLDEYIHNYASANNAEFAQFSKEMKSFTGDANFIGQFILINMADPMKNMTSEESIAAARRYVTYTVNGRPLAEFAKKPGVNWHESALKELAAFGEKIENLAK